MTTPDTEPATPPPQAEWVHIPDPPAEHRSESVDSGDEDRGRPVGQWVAGGASGAALGGVGLWSAFGPVGLAAGAITAAGGAAAYGVYRLRRGRQAGLKVTRTRTKTGRSTSRLGSVGKGGRGKGLLGGKGAKLGKGHGPKLGGRGAKLGGKSGKLLGGKAGKLGGGRAGKLLGGGRGSKLGGKAGLGLGKGRSTSRLGSVGSGRLGRGGKAGLGLGKRGGKVLGGKGKTGLGRWSKATGAGAGILGGKLSRAAKKLGGKAGSAALRTKTGRRAGGGFRAAKTAMTGKSAKGSWSRFRQASRAARPWMGSSRNPFAQWAAGIAAAIIALTAMAHDRWKARQAKKAGQASGTQTTTTTTTTTTGAGTQTTTTTTTRAPGPGVINPTRIHQRRSMTAFPLAAGAAEMNAAAAAHAPQSMMQVANELDQFGEVPTQVALAVRSYTMRLESDYPIHPAVVEKIQEYAIAEAQLKSIADEIGPLFRQVHAKDLERFEAPRTNEQAWDVTSV